MAEKLAALPLTKLKLLESAFKNLADVAKNSGPLNDLFGTMKEGSMITAPWQTFLNILGAESTKASVEAIKDLFAFLKDPSTKDAIDLLAGAVGAAMTVVADLTQGFVDFLVPSDEVKGFFEGFAKVIKDWYEDPLGQIVSFINDINAAITGATSTSTTAWIADVYGGGITDPREDSGRGGYQE